MQRFRFLSQILRLLAAIVALFSCPLVVHAKSSGSSGGVVHVNGYTKKDGTYVAPHDRTAPNHTKDDNWSTKGNVNPETGKPGTKEADDSGTPSQPASSPVSPGLSTPKGWAAMKSRIADSEVKRTMGSPTEVTTKNGIDAWSYPTGTVWVKDGKVLGWRQNK